MSNIGNYKGSVLWQLSCTTPYRTLVLKDLKKITNITEDEFIKLISDFSKLGISESELISVNKLIIVGLIELKGMNNEVIVRK